MESGKESDRLLARLEAIAAPIIRSFDFELVGVECAGQGARTVLRVFIDKPGGVNVGDCEQVHVSLGHALDLEDPFPHSYTLEVSSPGLDRPFRRRRDYERALGKRVTLKLVQPLHGQWRIRGRLTEVHDSGVTLAGEGPGEPDQVELGWEAIAEARLEIEF